MYHFFESITYFKLSEIRVYRQKALGKNKLLSLKGNQVCTFTTEYKQVMKKFFTKAGLLGLSQKGQEQGVDLQNNALTSLVHFAVQLDKVD